MAHDDEPRDDDVAGDPGLPEFDEPMAMLAGLTFLRPDAPNDPAIGPIPAWAWDRIDAALTAESQDRSAAEATADAVVVPLDSAPSRASRSGRAGYRWVGGLVAAALVVVVGGVVVTSLRTTSDSSDAVVAAVAFATTENAAAEDAAAGTAATGGPVAVAEAAPAPKMGGSGWVQPARMVLASGTDYTPAALGTQVTNLLDGVGIDTADEARAMPVDAALASVGTGGFTASMPALRDCVTALTESTQSQALVVDRATYQGNDAGVVVAPTYDDATATSVSPAPTTTLTTDMGELDVWVVNPDCSVVDPRVLLHVLHHWMS